MKKKQISIIIPMLNEEANFNQLYSHLNLLATDAYEWQFIFVDDGSSDKTWQLINAAAFEDSRVKGVSFSRNFGHQKALAAGYEYATGDALVTIDADLQDPPELITALVAEWEKGFKIVYARRTERQDSWFLRYAAWGYYKFLHYAADVFMPRSVGDFRLIDATVYENVKHSPEAANYWRGTVAWTGYSYTFVDFVRNKRAAGVSGYTWANYFRFAFNGLTGFSFLPLQIAGYIGIALFALSLAAFLFLSWSQIFYRVSYGFAVWISAFFLLLMAGQFLALWLLGEYIGRIYEHQKERPLYVTKETCGFGTSVNLAIKKSSVKNL